MLLMGKNTLLYEAKMLNLFVSDRSDPKPPNTGELFFLGLLSHKHLHLPHFNRLFEDIHASDSLRVCRCDFASENR